MTVEAKTRVCKRCGEAVFGRILVVCRHEELISFHPRCYSDAVAEGIGKAPSYNVRPLGFPKVQGGKVAPGTYRWSD